MFNRTFSEVSEITGAETTARIERVVGPCHPGYVTPELHAPQGATAADPTEQAITWALENQPVALAANKAMRAIPAAKSVMPTILTDEDLDAAVAMGTVRGLDRDRRLVAIVVGELTIDGQSVGMVAEAIYQSAASRTRMVIDGVYGVLESALGTGIIGTADDATRLTNLLGRATIVVTDRAGRSATFTIKR